MFSLQQLRMRKTNFDMELPIVHQHSGSDNTGSAMTALAAGFYRTSRWLCLLTTCLAFLLGVGVGVAVPLFVYTLPGNYNTTATALLESSTGATLPVELVLTSSDNVSDVGISVPPLPPVALQVEKRLAKARRRMKNLAPSSMYNRNVVQRVDSAEEAETKVPTPASVVSFVESEQQQPLFGGAGLAEDDALARSSSTLATVSSQPVAAGAAGEAVQGVYWSQAVEDILPAGFDEHDAEQWHTFSREAPIVKLEEGCGRMQNRLITFGNGTRSCCRYRQNFDQIQGEIFSFYLSRLLGLRNLPPSALGLVRSQDQQWDHVRSSLSLAQWTEDRPVVYTRYLDDLEPAYIPEQLRGSDRHLHPTDVNHIRLLSASSEERNHLITLAQWSDLLVFDYLTANLDRMVNNMYNMQWNPAMMDSPAHNLAHNTQTGLLVFLDNESGLLHGYRLLNKYEVYHKSLLDSVCIFRRSTIEALRSLQSERNIGQKLRHVLESQDAPLVDYLPFLPEKSIKTLNHRIDRVLDQVAKCQNLYGADSSIA